MRQIIFPLLFLGLIVAMEFYVFNGLKVLFKEGMPKWAKWTYWSLTIFPILWIFIAMLFLQGQMNTFRVFNNLMVGILFTLLATKAVFSIFLLVEDIYRIFSFGYNKIGLQKPNTEAWESRRQFIGQIGLAVAAIPFFSFLYGVTRGKYAYTVHNSTISFPDLPEAFDGFRIAQISDVHSGSFDSIAAVKRGLELLQEQKADIILFTGDLVNSRSHEIEPFIDLFKNLSAPFGKFSVLGNHDYYGGDESLSKLKGHHASMGFRLMLNESLLLEKDGQKIRLAGVENWGDGPFPKKGDLDKTFAEAADDDFCVLMSHDPSHWEKKILDFSKKIHLTLSGHTHGMQLGVEVPGLKWSPSQWRYPQWAGLYEKAGKYIYVNRGFGFLGFPGRVGILPEITVLELKKAQ